jgi:single-stranded DNA-binding protein
MNNLNSVLLEGVFAGTPEYSEKENKCTFGVQTSRFNKVDGAITKKTNIFTATVTGKMAAECAKRKKGSGVRVVGALDTDENNSVVIVAEHIEYRPEK